MPCPYTSGWHLEIAPNHLAYAKSGRFCASSAHCDCLCIRISPILMPWRNKAVRGVSLALGYGSGPVLAGDILCGMDVCAGGGGLKPSLGTRGGKPNSGLASFQGAFGLLLFQAKSFTSLLCAMKSNASFSDTGPTLSLFSDTMCHTAGSGLRMKPPGTSGGTGGASGLIRPCNGGGGDDGSRGGPRSRGGGT